MSKTLQVQNYDPFAESGNDETGTKNYIHIRIQQRNGRKTITTVQGLPPQLDQKKILKAFKKIFACNGSLAVDDELGEVIQLQGDHRQKISDFLVEEGITKLENIKVHGF